MEAGMALEAAIQDVVREQINGGNFNEEFEACLTEFFEKDDFRIVRDSLKDTIVASGYLTDLLKSETFLDDVTSGVVSQVDAKTVLLAALSDQDKEGIVEKILKHNEYHVKKFVKEKIDEALSEAYAQLDDAIHTVVGRKIDTCYKGLLAKLVDEKVASLSLWNRLFPC